MSEYAESFLWEALCGLTKAHSSQHSPFKLFQPWPKEQDSGGFEDTVMMVLPKAYDYISNKLLIAKLQCYGIDKDSLRLLLDYLTNRNLRAKIGPSFNSSCSFNTGVPQRSIHCPLLFNIFINYFFP